MAKRKRKTAKKTVRKKAKKKVVEAADEVFKASVGEHETYIPETKEEKTEEQKREAKLAEKERLAEEERVEKHKKEVAATLEKARNIKCLDTRWCEGYRECEVITRRDRRVNSDRLYKTMRIQGGGPKGQGFCVLIFG